MEYLLYGICLLVPILMVVSGIFFVKSRPKKINAVIGYRTKMSMKNKDTWDFAHKYCGKLFLVIGVIAFILSAISVIVGIFLLHNGVVTVGKFCVILITAQLVLLIIIVLFTEKALRANFDNAGNRTK